MGAVSHYLEDEGIATTGISLVRENTEQMQLPRFLWVPFELGRPFGAPHEPAFQRRVLRAALELLEREDGPVVLEDFPDDAPQSDTATEPWSCPISFAPKASDDSDLVQAVLEERRQLAPWHERYVAERGGAAPPASSLSPEDFVRRLAQLSEGALEDLSVEGAPLTQWVRLGCDDLRTWYMEAARGRPGNATSRDLADWFWRETALARLIGGAGAVLAAAEHPALAMFGRRVMVPREYMDELMPGMEPYV